MAGITVPIDGDLSPILDTFGKLPGRTQEEMAAVGAVIEREAKRGAIAKGFAEVEGVSASSAKRAANAVIREMERASQETRKANEAAAREAAAVAREMERRMEQAARESSARFGDMKKGATVAFGGIVGDIEDVAGAMMALGPASALVGGAIAGAAVVAGTAWLGSEVVAYLYEAADATGQLTEEQTALTAALEKIQLTLGERVAPQFESALLVAIQLALRTNDLVQAFIAGRDAVMDYYESMGLLARVMAAPVTWSLELTSNLERLGGAMVGNTGRAQRYIDRMSALEKAQKSIDEAVKLGTEAQEEAKRSQKSSADQRARDSKRAADRVAAEAERERKARTDAAQKEAEALAAIRGRQALQEIEDDQALTATILETDAEMTAEAADNASKRAAFREAAAARVAAAAQAEADAEAEAAAQRQAATVSYVESGISAAATLAQAVADGANEGSEAQRNAAMIAFRANQAGALASIGINTAEAASKAIAMFGPPPSPLGIAGIAAAAALGVAQAAAVAAQAPPTFHAGGMIASNPLAPDETMIIARKGEEIRTRQEQGGGAPVIVQMRYEHRIFDTFVSDNMKQTGSPLRREITSRSGRLLGHRERAR